MLAWYASDLAVSSTSRATRVYLLFLNDTTTTEIYTLSLHDALPISTNRRRDAQGTSPLNVQVLSIPSGNECAQADSRSEEHTSELQSRQYLVCRLLLEKKNRTEQGNGGWRLSV